MDKEEIRKLSELSRLYIEEREMESLANEIEAILGYVEDVKKIASSQSDSALPLKNVFRDDINPHEGGIFTDDILKNAPTTEGRHFKVKKIL